MDRRRFFSSAVVGSVGVAVGTAALTAKKPAFETEVLNKTGHGITLILPPAKPGVTVVVTNNGNNSITVRQSL